MRGIMRRMAHVEYAPFIVSTGTMHQMACVNYMPDSDSKWSLYAQGHLVAARAVADHALRNRQDLDVAVFPLGLLYRHHIELVLKQIAVAANRLLARDEKFLQSHKIGLLWERCSAAYRRVYGKEPELSRYDETVEALHRLDPNGMTFRYPVGLDGAPTLPPDFQRINIAAMRDAFEDLAAVLDGIHLRMGEDAALLDEMHAEFGPRSGW